MHHDHLEPLADGFVAFHAKDGKRWKHKDVESSRTGGGYRLFISDSGEERRYTFGAAEPHDTTLFDLRDQLERAKSGPAEPSRPMPPDREATPGGA